MSDWEAQIEEFESIQSIYDQHKLSFDDELFDNVSNAKKVNLTFTLSLTDNLIIHCVLPSDYPSKSSPKLFIRSLSSSKHSKKSIEDANNLIKARIFETFEAGNPLLFDILDWTQTNIPSIISVANNFKNISSKVQKMKKFKFQRSFIWFHHINRKKHKLDALTKEYGFCGFCVTGKPGVCVVEGAEDEVNEYIAKMKKWSWKRMIVRHCENKCFWKEDEYENAHKYKEWTLHSVPMGTKGGMKIVYEWLKKAKLEKYYKMIVHINTPIDCTSQRH